MILTDSIKENSLIAKEYKELLKISYQSLNNEDRKLIRLAFNTAVDAHKDQRRRSGERTRTLLFNTERGFELLTSN